MIGFVWSMSDFGYSGVELRYLAAGLTVACALLMVSRIRYTSFKGDKKNERVPFWVMLLIVGFLVALLIDPPRVLLTVAVAYAMSGPLYWLWHRARRPRAAPHELERRTAAPAAGPRPRADGAWRGLADARGGRRAPHAQQRRGRSGRRPPRRARVAANGTRLRAMAPSAARGAAPRRRRRATCPALIEDLERLRREPALKRALWPRLRALRRSH